MGSAPIAFKPRPTAATGSASGVSAPGAARTILRVEDMTCGSCANRVQTALGKVPGVAWVQVELDAARATVSWKPDTTPDSGSLIAAAVAAGYAASLPPVAPSKDESKVKAPEESATERSWRRAVRLGIPVTLTMMIAEWAFGLGMNSRYRFAALLLSLPVQIVVGAGFYRGAWRQARVGQSNMDTLVALGSTAAFGFSLWILASGTPGHVYFMESAGILTLISLGHWLEARMSARAGASLRALLTLAPVGARIRRTAPDGTFLETEVPASSLRPGDLLILRPGDHIPVDSEVIEGDSAVDESMLTGESVPVVKGPSARVYAGTLNTSGRLVACVVAIGSETALARIVAAVQRAQSSRASIQRLADQISAVFVPVVIVIAFGAALGWAFAFEPARALQATLSQRLWHVHAPDSPLAAAFTIFASVLIVACPCAMGLATPAALMAGVNAAARQGILIRDATALEKTGRITTVVFDKTGTLTEGHPKVVARAAENAPEADSLAAALADPSSHPLSRAVAELSATNRPTLAEWRERRGLGVEARRESGLLRLGSPSWLKESGIEFGAFAEFVEKQAPQGASVLLLSLDSRVIGAYGLRDAVKSDARAVIQRLRADGLRVHLLSGDQPQAVGQVARELGLQPGELTAGVRPEQKAVAIEALQQRGERVAFVGDGLNDGPALAQADLGIAVLRATDVAREAADVVLLRPDLNAVCVALELSRQTLRVIHQNLFWAFFYNAAFVPLAALGLFSPLLSAVAMGLSDVIVIGNALRLARKR